MTNQEKFDAICRYINEYMPDNWQEVVWDAMGNHMASVFDQSPERIFFSHGDASCVYRPSVVAAAEHAILTLVPTKTIIYINGQVILQHD